MEAPQSPWLPPWLPTLVTPLSLCDLLCIGQGTQITRKRLGRPLLGFSKRVKNAVDQKRFCMNFLLMFSENLQTFHLVIVRVFVLNETESLEQRIRFFASDISFIAKISFL